MLGVQSQPSTAVELPDGVKRLARITLTGAQRRTVRAWLDGLGSGSGNQTVRGLLHDTNGNLLVTGTDVTITSGQATGVVDLPFPTLPGAGDYILAVHAGGPGSRRARLWVNAPAQPVVNYSTKPSFETDVAGMTVNAGTVTQNTTDAAPGGGTKCAEVANVTGTTIAILNGPNTGLTAKPIPPLAFTIGLSFGGWMKVVSLSAGTISSFRMSVRWFDAAGAIISTPDVPGSIVNAPAVGSWVWSAGVITPPANAVSYTERPVYILSGSATVTVRLDNIMITPSATPVLFGFGDTPGWTWDGIQYASASRGPQGVVNLVARPSANGGSVALWSERSPGILTADAATVPPVPPPFPVPFVFRQTRKTDGLGLDSVYQRKSGTGGSSIPVTEGKTYSFGAWFLAGVLTNLFTKTIFINFTDATGTALGAGTTVANGTMQAGLWTQAKAENFVAPAGARFAEFRVQSGLLNEGDYFWTCATQCSEGATLAAYADGDLAGCDWLGVQYTSPSIQWKVPEVFDLYSDGPAATTGLTPAGAKVPADVFQCLAEEPIAAALDAEADVQVTLHPNVLLRADLEAATDMAVGLVTTVPIAAALDAEADVAAPLHADITLAAALEAQADLAVSLHRVLPTRPAGRLVGANTGHLRGDE